MDSIEITLDTAYDEVECKKPRMKIKLLNEIITVYVQKI